MITIEDTSSLKVIVNVEEADILKIQEGMPATVSTDATGDEEIKGTVTRVVRVKNQSTNTNGTDTNTSSGYSAEITIDNTELLVGMSAKAKIVIKDRGTQLAVPYDLIRQDDNGDSYVLVAEANEDGTATAVRKNIKGGEEVDYYAEVTGGDLKEGDQLIYDNTFSVTEGQVFTPEQIYSNQALDSRRILKEQCLVHANTSIGIIAFILSMDHSHGISKILIFPRAIFNSKIFVETLAADAKHPAIE